MEKSTGWSQFPKRIINFITFNLQFVSKPTHPTEVTIQARKSQACQNDLQTNKMEAIYTFEVGVRKDCPSIVSEMSQYYSIRNTLHAVASLSVQLLQHFPPMADLCSTNCPPPPSLPQRPACFLFFINSDKGPII